MITPSDDSGYINIALELDKDGYAKEKVVLREKLMLPGGKWEMALVEMYYELSDSYVINPIEDEEKRSNEVYNWCISLIYGVQGSKIGFDDSNRARYEREILPKKWSTYRGTNTSQTIFTFKDEILNKKVVKVSIGDVMNNFNTQTDKNTYDLHKLSRNIGSSWEGVPELYLVGTKVELRIPIYVKVVAVGKKLAKLLGFTSNYNTDFKFHKDMVVVYERQSVKVPSPYTGHIGGGVTLNTGAYYMIQRIHALRGLHDSDCMLTSGKNILIYCGQLEYRLVGNVSTPLLRFTSLTTKKHFVNYVQFNSLQYYKLLVNELSEFDIKLYDELGQPIKFYETDPTLVLHIRRRIDTS